MFTGFFDMKQLITIDFIERVSTVNRASYIQHL